MLRTLLFAAVAAAGARPLEIHEDVHLLQAAPYALGRQPDGNTVVLRGPDGLIVVDTGRHAAHAARITEFARDAAMPVAAIVNTHWHLDHVGGNARVLGEFPHAAVHASAAVRGAHAGFLARYRRDLEAQLANAKADDPARAGWQNELAIIDGADALFPAVVLDVPGELVLAGRRVRVGVENAATLGDVWLYDAASRVLVAGDLVTLPAPFLDTACPARWRDALARLDAVPFETLVPGHGPPLSRADVARYRQAFGNLLDCAAGDAAKTACIDGWLADAGPLVPAAQHATARGLLDYYLDATLRAKPDPALCSAP